MKRFAAELALLAAAVAAPLLPAPWSAAALFAVAALWLALRPPRREVWIAGVALVAAAAVLVAGWVAERGPRAGDAAWSAGAQRHYASLWNSLWGEAKAAAATLAPLVPESGRDLDRAARMDAFRRLAQLEVGAGGGRHGLLLVDSDGAAVAWAGEGLLHELKPEAMPRAGPAFAAGWSAATLLAVEPVDASRRPWRVIAGASFPTRELPFGRHEPLRWSLVRDPREADPRAIAVALPGAPTLVVARRSLEPPPPDAPPPHWRLAPPRFAWLAIGFALFALTVMRGIAIALPSPAGSSSIASVALERRTGGLVLLAVGAGIALGAAAGVPAKPLAVLGLGLALAALALRRPPVEVRARTAPPPPPSPSMPPEMAKGDRAHWRSAVGGAAAVLALAALAWGFEALGSPLDPAGAVLGAPAAMSLRLAFVCAAFGLLAFAGRPATGEGETGDGWAWLAVALLAGAAAAADLLPLALALLAAGGAAASRWVAGRDIRRSGMAFAALALVAALAGSAALEPAYRLRLDRYAARELLPTLAPPSAAALDRLRGELSRYFTGRDLAELVPRAPAGLEPQDLAFALWRGSPLARRSSVSALVVEPLEGARSSFSFGLPLTEEGKIDTTPSRWEGIRPPPWQQETIEATVPLTYRGVPWARARYSLLPLPGFTVADRRRLLEVEVGLLRGGPTAARIERQTAPTLYALYDREGRALLSPWEEAPPLDDSLRGARSAIVTTPDGPARAHARRTPSGWEAVYLPFETPLSALERTGTIAVSGLLALALAVALALLLALPRAAFRDLLRRTVRSYSKRLLLVYSALLLVPLFLLNAVLVREMEVRLEAFQRAAGEAALKSAQRDLGAKLVDVQPGFEIASALNNGVLSSLSQLVHHEVNLYWRSQVQASSKGELFTAGLLPKRIPGEIYARLALVGYDLSSRTNRAGGTEYLELYAPLRLPGAAASEERLFLSIPLLAQQEESAAELGHLRRRALLMTAALVALSVAVGSRLARNFTRPLAQLVEGTRRIAAGAPSLDFRPAELELVALSAAVDEMARKIADGRDRLLREKQVVERVVENITSGVVSVDRGRRVLMHNRVAAELLGVAAGQNLDGAVARRPLLAPVAAFLKSAGGELQQATVRLSGEGGAGGAGDRGDRDGRDSREGHDGREAGEREWTLIWAPVPGAGEPAALFVVEDATEILRGQRLLAWAAMARMIAHEIKNPLTPIRLSTEHMREVYERDPARFAPVFERCTANILAQVDELRSIASEFSAYSAIPRIDPQPGDLGKAISALVEGYRAAPPEGVSVELIADGPIPARFDAKLVGRAVRNLLENALRASVGGGRVTVRVERQERADRRAGEARIVVQDDGPGVRPELLGRIFDPYFSTHDTGTGLGLPIARRIAEEHGGSITARNRPEGGLEVAITLPVDA
jgi:signal transduction histidine kinase